MGLTASDIMDNATPTEDIEFINILNPHTGEKISGAHTGTLAGRYAHMELDELFKESINYSEYVDKVRDWADKHLKGGADALPWYFKPGSELPKRLRQNQSNNTNVCKEDKGD